MSFIREYLIFFMIGAMPSLITDYNVFMWQWWVIVLTLDTGVWLYAHEMHRQWSK